MMETGCFAVVESKKFVSNQFSHFVEPVMGLNMREEYLSLEPLHYLDSLYVDIFINRHFPFG